MQLVVVVVSIARHRPGLALGNVVGSTIANTLGAFSLGLIFYRPADDAGTNRLFERSSVIYSVALLLIATVAAAVLAWGEHIHWRAVGFVFIAVFGVYITSISYLIAKGFAKAPEEMSDSDSDSDSELGADSDSDEERPLQSGTIGGYGSIDNPSTRSTGPLLDHQRPPHPGLARRSRFRPPASQARILIRHLAFLSGGFVAVVISGYVLSCATSNLVDETGISDVLAGVVILSIATTIPEKFVALMSGYKGHADILLANTVGSNIFLLTLCLGITWAAASGDGGPANVSTSEIVVMLGSAVLMTLTVLLQGRFARFLGWAMLVLYIAFLVLEFTYIHKL